MEFIREWLSMSNLLDDVVKNCIKNNVLIGDKWFIAKPLSNRNWMDKLSDAVSCLKGKSIAVHFKEDEI